MALPQNSRGLWTACVLPGDGPEFRFTATPARSPLHVLRSLLRFWRKETR